MHNNWSNLWTKYKDQNGLFFLPIFFAPSLLKMFPKRSNNSSTYEDEFQIKIWHILDLNQFEESAERNAQPKGKTSPKSREETAVLEFLKETEISWKTNLEIAVFFISDCLLHEVWGIG